MKFNRIFDKCFIYRRRVSIFNEILASDSMLPNVIVT